MSILSILNCNCFSKKETDFHVDLEILSIDVVEEEYFNSPEDIKIKIEIAFSIPRPGVQRGDFIYLKRMEESAKENVMEEINDQYTIDLGSFAKSYSGIAEKVGLLPPGMYSVFYIRGHNKNEEEKTNFKVLGSCDTFKIELLKDEVSDSVQFTHSPKKNTVRCRYSNMKKGNVTHSASVLVRQSLMGSQQSIKLETPAKHEEKEKLVSEFENTELRKEIEREKNKKENVRISFQKPQLNDNLVRTSVTTQISFAKRESSNKIFSKQSNSLLSTDKDSVLSTLNITGSAQNSSALKENDTQASNRNCENVKVTGVKLSASKIAEKSVRFSSHKKNALSISNTSEKKPKHREAVEFGAISSLEDRFLAFSEEENGIPQDNQGLTGNLISDVLNPSVAALGTNVSASTSSCKTQKDLAATSTLLSPATATPSRTTQIDFQPQPQPQAPTTQPQMFSSNQAGQEKNLQCFRAISRGGNNQSSRANLNTSSITTSANKTSGHSKENGKKFRDNKFVKNIGNFDMTAASKALNSKIKENIMNLQMQKENLVGNMKKFTKR